MYIEYKYKFSNHPNFNEYFILITLSMDASPSMATIKNWLNEFKRCCTSIFDGLRPGSPKRLPQRIANETKIHYLLLVDPRWKMLKIADTEGISKDCTGIIYGILGMRKLSATSLHREAQRVPCLLIAGSKLFHESSSEQCLTLRLFLFIDSVQLLRH